MKKVVCVLVLACVIMGGAFAQAKPAASAAKNAIGFDLIRLFDVLSPVGSGMFLGTTISFAYERQIVPHWSIGPDADIGIYGRSGFFGFRLHLAAEGRFYPTANFDKLFFGTTVGFKLEAGSGGGHIPFGLAISLKTGYKFITSKKLYLEPSLIWNYDGLYGNYFWGGLRLGWVF